MYTNLQTVSLKFCGVQCCPLPTALRNSLCTCQSCLSNLFREENIEKLNIILRIDIYENLEVI